jgi:acetoin utilization protein AcuB
MIVKEVMTTKLVLVETGDTLSHAANLLRQYQFHHLPVVQMPRDFFHWFPGTMLDTKERARDSLPILEGLLTSHDIDIAVALGAQNSGNIDYRPWQKRHVAEAMHPAPISVSPTTSLAAAAQLLVERGISCLPVVEYIDAEKSEQPPESTNPRNVVAPLAGAKGGAGTLSGGQVTRDGGMGKEETRTVLVGLLTRSDLLMALARSMGAFQPGIELHILLPDGDLTPLAKMLMLASELHINVCSIIAGPLEGDVPSHATVRLGTIYPTPLLLRLQDAGIEYEFMDTPPGGDTHV